MTTARYWATVLCKPNQHQRHRAIAKPARQFACVRCGARFERRGHLQSHIDTVHDRKRPFPCPRACGKVFGHRSSLSRHIRMAHDNVLPPLRCPRL